MDQGKDTSALESDEYEEQEEWRTGEWEDSDDEGERKEAKREPPKHTYTQQKLQLLENFWVEDDDSEDSGNDDNDPEEFPEAGLDEDMPDLGFIRKSKKKKTAQHELSKYDAVLGELTDKQTKRRDQGSEGKSSIQTGAKENSPTLSTGERPPSETIGFTSACDMRLDTRASSVARSSVVTTTSEEESTERPKCYFIARELMTSERTYVKGLHLVEKAFRGAIKTYNMLTKEIVPEREMKTIFSNTGEIYDLHQEMLFALEKRIEHWDENPRIGDVIAERAPFFKMYSTYSIAFETAQSTLARCCRTCPELVDIIQRVESSPASRTMPITSYMLTPVQRVPRYELLLQNYRKNLPADSPDLKDTEIALKAVSEAAVHMDEQCKRLDNFQKVIKIQRVLIGNGNGPIVAPGREFIAKGPAHCVDGKKLKPCILFLFSDILIVARAWRHGLYKILYQLQACGIKVQDRKTHVLPNTFSIIGMRIYLYQANSEEEKIKWIKVLGETIERCTKGRSAESLARTSSMLKDKKMKAALAEVVEDVTTDGDNKDCASFFLDTELALASYCQISGYLRQKSSAHDCWYRRWFVVANLRVYSYHHHDDEIPLGFQFLSGCNVSMPDEDDHITRNHVLKLTLENGSSCFLQTDSQYDLDRWMGILSVAGMAAAESAV